MRDEPRRVLLGELDCAVLGGPKGDGVGDGPLVMLLHGFGAPGDNLVPLADAFPLPREVRWVFPVAPLALDPGFAGSNARAWWLTIPRGAGHSLAREEPPELPAARDALLGCLAAIPGALGDAQGKVVVGGFSQGAMLSTEVALSSAVPLAGLVVLSGTLLAEARWRASAALGARRGLRVFQSHGTHDPLLGFPEAERLRDLFTAGGMDVRFVRFAGQHEVTPPIVSELARYLKAIVDASG